MKTKEAGRICPLGKSDLLSGQGFPLTLVSQYWHVYVAGNIQQKLSHQKEQRARGVQWKTVCRDPEVNTQYHTIPNSVTCRH